MSTSLHRIKYSPGPRSVTEVATPTIREAWLQRRSREVTWPNPLALWTAPPTQLSYTVTSPVSKTNIQLHVAHPYSKQISRKNTLTVFCGLLAACAKFWRFAQQAVKFTFAIAETQLFYPSKVSRYIVSLHVTYKVRQHYCIMHRIWYTLSTDIQY